MEKKFLRMFVIITCFFGWIAMANAEKDYEAILNQLAPNGVITIKGVKPNIDALPVMTFNSKDDVLDMIMDILMTQYLNSIEIDLENNETESLSIKCTSVTQCTVNIKTREESVTEDGTPGLEIENLEASKEVTIKYEEPNSDLVRDAQELMKKIKKDDDYEEGKYHYITDGLSSLNYNYNVYKKNYIIDYERLHFFDEINELLDGRNYQIKVIGPSGNSPWAHYGSGCYSVIYYKDMPLAYGGVTFFTLRKIIYIPADTENNPESYIAAAKKIIDDYIPNNKITVRLLTKEEQQNENVDTILEEFEIPKKNTDGNIYILEENGEYIGWYILAKETENNKNKKPKFHKKDYDSKVSVKSNGFISMDTELQVEEIKEDSEEYQEIENLIQKENFQAYDISLYSDVLATNIKVLENGTFEVTLPVGENLKNKNLVVYYIKDDDTIEEHPVTLDEEGNAVFETNHFSTYILTEKKEEEKEEDPNLTDKEQEDDDEKDAPILPDKEKEEEVPQTLDSIHTMISLFVIGLTGCIGLILFQKLN